MKTSLLKIIKSIFIFTAILALLFTNGYPTKATTGVPKIISSGFAVNAGSVLGKVPGTGVNNILALDGSGDVNISGKLITTTNIQGGSTLTSGNALLVNTANTFSGNLLSLQVNGSTKVT